MRERYTVFETTWGWVGIVWGRNGLRRILLPFPERDGMLERVKREFPDAVATGFALRRLESEFNKYFSGEGVSFTAELDWAGHSPFDLTTWQATRTIPPGTTRTYRWLSNQIKRPHAQRAVGGALGRNPFPLIIPCHRVVRSDGGLGGFSAPGGIILKRKLLELEGVRFDQKGRVVG